MGESGQVDDKGSGEDAAEKVNYLIALPTSFTLAATFCGFLSLLVASRAQCANDFWAAGMLIGIAAILDGFDGTIARLTGSFSNFGTHLDSLSDTVSFGLAPAWLAYHWGLKELWPVGFLVAFSYTAAAAIRLARYNVQAAEKENPRYFTGLPSPLAAGLVAGLICAGSGYLEIAPPEGNTQVLFACYVVLVGVLMISNVPFRTSRELKKSRFDLTVALSTAVGVVVLTIVTTLPVAALAFCVFYLGWYIVAYVIALPGRLTRRRGKSG